MSTMRDTLDDLCNVKKKAGEKEDQNRKHFSEIIFRRGQSVHRKKKITI